jgi:hypothetical protein
MLFNVIYILGVKFWQAAPLAGTCIPVKVQVPLLK